MIDERNIDFSATLHHQLDELALLHASLLPGETLLFLDDGNDSDATDEAHHGNTPRNILTWEQRLARHSGVSPGADADQAGRVSPQPAHFAIRANDEGAPVWFEVLLPRAYTGALTGDSNTRPVVLPKGDQLGRREQEAWVRAVDEALATEEVQTSQYPIFELFSAHLLPLLHDLPSHLLPQTTLASGEPSAEPSTSNSDSSETYHALLTSHHLRSPQKRRFLAQTSTAHSLRGFAKVGHPGVIYACGPRQSVEAFVSGVRALTWLALRTRFVEPLPKGLEGDKTVKQWIEFEKVGEVVEHMRCIGRETYVVEMGIGSAGVK